ncbi:hypothetical protein GGR54DRAFT_583632 [Hypoxylon sp. NC1633]|nr:hypothetical protein GGR54DRAFT_583632 [Hypoxylon sp. NC1633]
MTYMTLRIIFLLWCVGRGHPPVFWSHHVETWRSARAHSASRNQVWKPTKLVPKLLGQRLDGLMMCTILCA